MFKTIMYLLVAVMVMFMFGCTDADIGKFKALGNRADVTCWSGGQLIYQGTSTGKVESETSSDGYYFQDEKSGRVMEVSGNCVITYHK